MITVVTPSVRPEMLSVVAKCLQRQTFKDYEWLIATPYSLEWKPFLKEFHLRDGYSTNVIQLNDKTFLVLEPPKKKGDYYSLNKAWNEAFRHAKGELIVSIQDGIWFNPHLLETFWAHYQTTPKACVGGIGHQYDQMVNGKPENLVWRDPRARTDYGSFWEINPNDLEWCVSSIPREALFAIGGIDEEYDKYAALSEKDANFRMSKLGYKFFLDLTLEYRAIKHPRLNDNWEKRYQAGCAIFLKHGQEIIDGKRLKLSYL